MISDQSIVAICGVATLLIGQLALYLKSRDNGKISLENKAVGLENKVEIQTVKEKALVIETHVNGEKSAAAAREALLLQENQLLRQALEDQKQTANLLAQSVAQALPSTPAST